MPNRYYVAGIVLAVMGVLLFGLSNNAALAQTARSPQQAMNTLRVSPLRTDISLDPGETSVVRVTIANPSSQSITIKADVNDFTTQDEDGTPALLLDDASAMPKHSLKQFLAPVADIVLAPKTAKAVEVPVRVPSSAEAGGYFGAIRFTPATSGAASDVNTSASVASLIILTVTGTVPEQLDLTMFEVQQKAKAGRVFLSDEALSVATRFANSGALQAGPFGRVSVTKGDTVVYETDFNGATPRGLVLPDSARRWDIPLGEIGGFGRYTAHATFTYGQTNQTIEVSKSFWIVPKLIVVALCVGFVSLLGGIVWWSIAQQRTKRRSQFSIRRSHRRRYR